MILIPLFWLAALIEDFSAQIGTCTMRDADNLDLVVMAICSAFSASS